MSWREGTVAADNSFACCLTHDVDRPFKTYQTVFNLVADRDLSGLADLLPHRNPYWTFEKIRRLERERGVRSTWYFLDEQSLFGDRPLGGVVDPTAWKLYAGRYSLDDQRIRDVIERLDENGWEIGLHGSYESYRDAELLRSEKETLESILGREVRGIRQHYLNVERPATWRRQRSVGFSYDASLGSTETCGFQYGYEPFRPFDDAFVVFPLTIMDTLLPDAGTDWDGAWELCERLLLEARDNTAVMTVLWHPRYFSDDYPGFTRLYCRLIERALELGAWVGPVGELYESLSVSTLRPSGESEQ